MRKFLAGVGSLLVLGVVLIGIPVALVFLSGNPIPTGEEFSRALTMPDFGGTFLIGSLLPIVAWIAWATFAVGVLIELPAQVRGIPAPRLPLLGIQQKFAAGLIGAVIVMFTGLSSVATTAPAMASPAEEATSTSVSQSYVSAPEVTTVADEAEAPAADAPAEDAASAPTYTVQDGDSLWRIAETYLGSGERFAEIADLNYGVTQADGHALTPSNWLNPGWVLTLPADATPAPGAASTPATETETQHHTVEAGDTMWDVAEEAYGDGGRYTEIFAASSDDAQPTGRTIANPDLILPGEVLEVPNVPVATSAAAPAPETVAPPAPVPAPAEEPDAATDGEPSDDANTGAAGAEDASADESVDDDLAGIGIAPSETPAETPSTSDTAEDDTTFDEIFNVRTTGGIGALMAAGLLTVLGIRRRGQRRKRKIGQRISMPNEQASTIELELRAVENPMGMDDIDHALRHLAVWAQDSSVSLPPLYAIRLADTEIALYLDAPTQLPAPFVSVADDDTAWTVEPSRLPELDRIPSPPYPALVTIGQDATDAHILVDLEHLGALNLIGPADLADGALTALAVELATSRWAEDLQITLVGIAEGLPRALNTGRVRHVDDLDTLLRNLRGQAAATERALESLGVRSIEEARSLNPDAEAWIPEIVILAELPPQEIQNELAELVTRLPRVGIAALTTGHLAGEWILNIDSSSQASLELPEGRGSLPIVPQILNDSEYSRILELLAATEQDLTPGPEWSQHIVQDEVDLDDLAFTADRRPVAVPTVDSNETVDDHEDDSWKVELRGLLPSDEAAAVVPVDEAAAPAVSAVDEVKPAAENVAETPAPVIPIRKAPYVRLLGPVAVVDARGEEPRTANASTIVRTTEYVAFLALNPGATAIDVHNALWPDQDPSGSKAAYNRNGQTSRARKWLGNADDGAPYLPPVTATNGYRLHPDIRTDWDLWQELVGDDVTQTPIEDLVAALKLVDGQPISGVKERYYVWAERIRQEMIASIGDAAHELAERALRTGDTSKARLAAAIGRQVDPVNEIFWRDALKAEHQAGDRTGFDRIVTQLENHLESFEDGYEAEPETQELIERARRHAIA